MSHGFISRYLELENLFYDCVNASRSEELVFNLLNMRSTLSKFISIYFSDQQVYYMYYNAMLLFAFI